MLDTIKKLFVCLNFCISITILLCSQTYAQKPIARFLTDSVSLGEPIFYSIAYKHKASSDVYFPDSTFNFAPFEYIDRVYFPTITTNGISVDSALYRLRTFSIDSIQKLGIYVTAIQNGDSSKIQSTADSIVFRSAITGVTNLNLTSDTGFTPLKIRTNLIPIVLKLVFGLFGFWIFWSIFGTGIKRQLSVFQLKRKHNEFSKTYKKYTKASTKENVEKALIYWKQYLGDLHQQSYNTMTTKEITDRLPNESLVFALKEIDEMVYGGKSSTKIKDAVALLEKYMAEEFKSMKMAIISKNHL